MTDSNTGYDGSLISELGVNRYLKGVQAQASSNVNFLFVATLRIKRGKNAILVAMGLHTAA
ncbi:MAG: hypothetical protein U5M23_13725 [Marinagarivorans sp.]|nr:hypothetical protein [Marinagarivorans sp.]